MSAGASFSPVVANAWYSSQANRTDRRLPGLIPIHLVDAAEDGALETLL